MRIRPGLDSGTSMLGLSKCYLGAEGKAEQSAHAKIPGEKDVSTRD